jgi:DNA (cytosine-5)-methyltransferase 1
MKHYYNEFDPQSAAWIRELIDRGLIPAGDVDTRSIIEVKPSDLHGYTQCHFFAGIAGWSLALKLAGIPSTRPLWTGSCPCQPFSVAGEGKGIEDDRHLWPVFFGLIRECRPPLIFGEQVASAEVVGSQLEASFVVAVQSGDYAKANKIAKRLVASSSFTFTRRWVDGIQADLETADYAMRFGVLGAHSVNAPHIRQRCYWGAVRMADSGSKGREGREWNGGAGETRVSVGYAGECGSDGGVADSTISGRERISGSGENGTPEHCEPIRLGHTSSGGLGIIGDASLAGSCGHPDGSGEHCGLAHTKDANGRSELETQGAGSGRSGSTRSGSVCRVADANGFDDDGAGSRASHDGGQFGGEGELLGSVGLSGRLADTERNGGRTDEQEWGPEGGNVDRRAGHWDDAYWHPCRDGKYRRVPTQSIFQPLVDGIPDGMGAGWSDCSAEIQELAEALQAFPLASPEGFKVKPRGSVRPGLLKGSGNAIVPQVAAEFVTTFIQTTE